MAIGWPEAIDGAPRRGLTAKEGFLVSRGMTAQPAGEESLTRLLRHRRSRRSRPSARSGHWRGRLERSRDGQKGRDGGPPLPPRWHRHEPHRRAVVLCLGRSRHPDPACLRRTSPHQRISVLATTADASPAPAVGRSQGRTTIRFPSPATAHSPDGDRRFDHRAGPHHDDMR